MSKYEDNVKRGMAKLDEHRPNWRASIQPDKLNMANPYWVDGSCCVLKQVFNNFSLGLDVLELDGSNDIEYGFEAVLPRDVNEYDTLTQEWLRQLELERSEQPDYHI